MPPPAGRAKTALASVRGQRLIEIGDDIGNIFNANRQTHDFGACTGLTLLLVGQLPMRR